VIKLTNVSIVRYKRAGKRFEIACYKNKVGEYRKGIETDLDEVLQIEHVYSNVSKGQLASSEDLKKAFGEKSEKEIVLEILKKGELQVGEKERSHELEQIRKEIANLVAEKCVDPTTQRPHTSSMIEKSMDQAHFAVNTNKSAKSQALDLIKKLENSDIIPIARAEMRIRLTLPTKDGKRLKSKIEPCFTNIEDQDIVGDEMEFVGSIQPGQFKVINDLLFEEVNKNNKSSDGNGRIETLSFSTAQQGDEQL